MYLVYFSKYSAVYVKPLRPLKPVLHWFFAADFQPLEAEHTKAKAWQQHKTNFCLVLGLGFSASSIW